ncbi:MAG: hypothetical protein ACRD0U_16670, partial [Acidimicrobiales bacterium]
MGTSSAKPAKLLRYRNGGLEQVAAWEGEVPKLTTDLTNLRGALADTGTPLPPECQVTVLFYETWFDTPTKNQRHLDEWVGDVANGFIRANGGDPAHYDINANLNVPMSTDDSRIVVGYASREESEQQAAADAAELDRILGEAGLVHPYDLMNNPEKLEELARQYPQLRDILARSARFGTDESYAVTLVNTLGPQNVRTMADLVNTFGIAQQQGMLSGQDPYNGFVLPFAAILGAADRSGRMDPAVKNTLLDVNAMDEPPMAGKNNDFIQEGHAMA